VGFNPIRFKLGEELTSELEEILKENARICRGDILTMTTVAGSGHPGGSLSSIDFLVLLYAIKEDLDEIYVSHAHISPAVYSALSRYGYFSVDMALTNFRRIGSIFEGHADKSVPGVLWNFGCLGQGLSKATAAACSMKEKGLDNTVYCLMGDGEQEKGQIKEAACHAEKLYEEGKLAKLIAWIDNNHLQISGRPEDVSYVRIPEWYRGFGWTVIECDGHDFKKLYDALLKAHETDGPVVIISETIMGKGVSFMENKKEYHGKPLTLEECAKALEELGLENKLEYYLEKRKQPIPNEPRQDIRPKRIWIEEGEPRTYYENMFSCREAYGNALEDLAKLNDGKIFGIDCDLGSSTKVVKIGKFTKKSYLQIGIEENHAATFAGGLSYDHIVFFSTFAVFAMDEVYNQMRMNDINRTNLKVVATHAGISVGEDGKSHHGIDYIGLARNLYNFKLIVPVDANQTDRVIRYIARERGNFFVALPRTKTEIVYKEEGKPYFGESYQFRYGRDDWVKKGDDGTIIALGYMTPYALKAAEILEDEGYSLGILAKSCPTTIDKEVMATAANTGFIFTLEDHNVETGMGATIGIYLAKSRHNPIWVPFGIERYMPSGKAEDLYKLAGLDPQSVAKRISKFFESSNH